MAFEKLSHPDQNVILSCLCAIAHGPFINDDWELQTRLGVHRSTLYKMIDIWPEIDDSADDSDETLAINNAMNEVCHGIRFSDADWCTWFKVDRNTIQAVYKRWSQFRGERNTGIM